MATKQLKPGDLYVGSKAIETIDGVTAHWGYTKSGPVRLVHVDLSPSDPNDGSEEFRVAGSDDPIQISTPNVDLIPDEIHGQASSEV